MKKICTLIAAGAVALSAAAAVPARSDAGQPAAVSQAKMRTHGAPQARKASKVKRSRLEAAKANREALKKSPRSGARRSAKALAAEYSVLYDETFAFCRQGSEASPVYIETDDYYNIPESMIGAANYGFGGTGLYQAGGQLFVAYTDPYEDDYGMLWTPDMAVGGQRKVSFDVRVANNTSEGDIATVVLCDYEYDYDYSDIEINSSWKHFESVFDCDVDTEDDALYFIVYAEDEADILVKNFVIEDFTPALEAPEALDYTGFDGTSFVAHWTPVEGATSYLLYVNRYSYYPTEEAEALQDGLEVEGNAYKVTGFKPGDVLEYAVKAKSAEGESLLSDWVEVAELLPVSNVSAFLLDNGVHGVWTADNGANFFYMDVFRKVPLTKGRTVALTDADLSGFESTGTVADPEVTDDFYAEFPEYLPGWTFTLPAYAEGAIGFLDDEMLSYFGLYASLESETFELSKFKDGKLHVSVDAASNSEYPSGLDCYLVTRPNSSYEWEIADYWTYEDALPSDFTHLEFDLAAEDGEGYLVFYTLTEVDSEGYYLPGALFFQSLAVTAESAVDGETYSLVGYAETEECKATLEFTPEAGVDYAVKVQPWLLDSEGYDVASGPYSGFAEARTGSVDELLSAPAGEAVYFTVDGLRVTSPAKRGLYIRRQGSKTEKVVL